MDPKQVLINLAASATLADHMGDMWNYIIEALDQVGVKPPEGLVYADNYEEALAKWLRKEHGATTVWGTEVGSEE